MRLLTAAVSSLWRSYATQTMGRPITKVPIPGVDHIIAVASGKGGVGKSTTAGQCGNRIVVLVHNVVSLTMYRVSLGGCVDCSQHSSSFGRSQQQ